MSLPLFSTSEEVLFKTCRLAHHFKHDLGFEPAVTNRKLSVGIATHLGLQRYYEGADRSAIQQALDEFADARWAELEESLAAHFEDRAAYLKDCALIEAMVSGYIEWVREERLDENYETVAVESSAYVEIPGAPCLLPVRMDLVQRDVSTGLLRVVDFKTVASFPTDLTGYQLSEQNGNYQLAALAIYGERPTELAYRELRKVVPSARSKPPYFREVGVRLTAEELLHRVEQYVVTASERFDPDRAIYSNPSSCCGSWRSDWSAPCLKVSAGASPIEALETSTAYKRGDAYARYGDDKESSE